MTTDAEIIRTVAQLPEPLKQELLHYAQYLFQNYSKTAAEQKVAKRGGFGIWKDKIWIADDFDEPLEDFKEYM